MFQLRKDAPACKNQTGFPHAMHPLEEAIMENQVAYTSRVKIERIKGPLRRAFLPHVPTPVFFGVHSEIAQHYGVDTNVHEPHAATLDYVVAAAAG
jgi:hypothetical protein